MKPTATIRPVAVLASLLAGSALALAGAAPPLAIRGRIVHTVAGKPIERGVVLIEAGKIKAVGPADRVSIPPGWRVLEAEVVTPGLIDAHATVGLTGLLNGRDQAHDQEQLENSAPIQPQLRAIDGYNPLDPLIEWVRSFGVTTVHSGHAPGETVAGGTLVAKLRGTTVEQAVVVRERAVAASLGPASLKPDKSPGTRAKQVAMLRAELIKAQEADRKRAAKPDDPPERDIGREVWSRVLKRELPLMITAHRAQDILGALRLAKEFGIELWLDGASEAYLVADELRQAKVPVIARPSMMRAVGEQVNATVELPQLLRAAGVPVTMGSGYENYVPKVRVILFEAAQAAAQQFGPDAALAMITRDAAQLLGLGERIGTLEVGKDADLALYDGDPFEYTTHCVATVINGELLFEGRR